MIPDERKQELIIRQSCLRTAVELLKDYQPNKDLGIAKEDVAIAVAKKFEEYINEIRINLGGK